ncbi:hypothetical protein [Streptomyces eurocidicus]|uniref:Uncharacterized protein n=1 Tax=Streptomyces eurocidicus TaxID=66423 RepID=A0A7W8BG19_STREU|nr:hypothetical protein [Streptomyces eurocidicus]MBB5122751.1 hypothetical protein [Streptomyces eurocidicus]MBF6055204.1 hypothetical protein [Streptomyces eurocidicus]
MRITPPSPNTLLETPRCTACRYLVVALRQAQAAGDSVRESEIQYKIVRHFERAHRT